MPQITEDFTEENKEWMRLRLMGVSRDGKFSVRAQARERFGDDGRYTTHRDRLNSETKWRNTLTPSEYKNFYQNLES